jgi:hypothetical protein
MTATQRSSFIASFSISLRLILPLLSRCDWRPGGFRVGFLPDRERGASSAAPAPSQSRRRERSDMTGRSIGCAALLALMVLSPAKSQGADGPVGLQVRWAADPPRSGLQAVCGHVSNDRPMTAVRVRLRVEGLNEQGAVTGQREAEVLGQVPSGGNALYCITMFAGAATYRVTVVGVEWTGGSDGS